MGRHFGTMGAAPVSASLPSGLTIAEMSKVFERLRTPTVESDDQATGHVLLDGKVLRFEVMGSAIRFRFTGVTHPLRSQRPKRKCCASRFCKTPGNVSDAVGTPDAVSYWRLLNQAGGLCATYSDF